MEILIFAHRKEATHFINELNLKKHPFIFPGLYFNGTQFLLITGQGIQNTSVKLAAVLSHFENKIKNIINLGIAGRTSDLLETGRIYAVRKVFTEQQINKKSFTCRTATAKFDCLSMFQPISSFTFLDFENNIGLVDMELWAVGWVANFFKIPFSSFKMVSDDAREKTDKKSIIKKSDFFSSELLLYYRNYYKSETVR